MDNKESRNITPDQIKRLVDEMKKINKKIDLKNPLISEGCESFVSNALNEDSSKLRERELDVDSINKSKNVIYVNESEKDKWKRMLKYDVPTDETRDV